MFDYSAFGASFACFRRKSHFSIDDLSQMLGVSKSHIYNVEQGNAKIGVRFIVNACNIFKTNVKSFMNFEQEHDSLLQLRFQSAISRLTPQDKRLLLNITSKIEQMKKV